MVNGSWVTDLAVYIRIPFMGPTTHHKLLPNSPMPTKTEITFLQDDEKLFSSIAEMFYNEWQVDRSLTVDWLKKRTGRKLPFVLVAHRDAKPIGIAALDNEVKILSNYPESKQYTPLVSLLYVLPEYRNMGIASLLCNKIEAEAFRTGISRVFLYARNTDTLYKKLGWKEMERVLYKAQETVVMYKDM